MNEDRYRDKLGDYVDGSLSGPERQGLEAHLETCESCRAMTKDLVEIKQAAGSLERVTPPENVWGRIANSIHGQDAHDSHNWKTRSSALSAAIWSHRWALAAVIVLLIGALGVMNKLDFFGARPPEGSPEWVAEELRAAEEHYENAIRGLEAIVEKDQSTLDPELMAVLRQNLTLIEDAIAESRAATRQQPESLVAGESLLAALRRKLSLLQNTVLLINEVRKGQGESALDLIDEMRDSGNPSTNPG